MRYLCEKKLINWIVLCSRLFNWIIIDLELVNFFLRKSIVGAFEKNTSHDFWLRSLRIINKSITQQETKKLMSWAFLVQYERVSVNQINPTEVTKLQYTIRGIYF